ncbi:hypothetical protein EXT48_05430 [Pseudoalteromonas sp. CO348]|uniref:hypothetical protein n=1 Tax=Pseudoalteromonas TaxID=53246 RepID=UPI00102387EC|nr:MULTISPECIES: hypothetical protein [Pseudoalteromonas]RZG07769.1 hypothetical protein EXT48_05430 [Pseudoalteromonas sp. CO348]WMO13144.1 hypothetical protein NI376_13870 [Pseudoalteromonas piscicida]
MKKSLAIVVFITAVVGIAVFVIGDIQKKTLKEAIASAVNVEPSKLLLNLPPKHARFPGSILSPSNSSFMVYSSGDADDESILRGEQFTIEAVVNDMSNVQAGGKSSLFNNAFSNDGQLEVTLNIKDAFIAELPIGALKEKIAKNVLAQAAMENNIEPIIVSRAYVGVVEYVVRALNESGVKTLVDMSKTGYKVEKARLGSFNFSDNIEDRKEISFSINSPIVFAYEVMEASYVATDLSDKGALVLNELSSRRVAEIGNENPVQERKTNNSFGVVTIANAHYANFRSLDIPQSTEASLLMRQFFESYDPVFVKQLNSTKQMPISDDKLLDWTVDLTLELLENPVEHLVVYYTGHALSLPNGEIVLLQGNVNKDYAERAAQSYSPSLSESGDGLILVEQLYNALSMANVPFTLMIDACYPNDEMADALTRVSMLLGDKEGTELYYIGDSALITNELSDIGKVMRQIGSRFEYRQQNNAVIFSSKPGAKSVFKSNPVNPYGFELPPLAARILKFSDLVDSNNRKEKLSKIVRMNIDSLNGVGEISLSGSITWSNLETMMNSL